MHGEIKPGTVYWITGLAGAGKTSIGTLLYHKIRETKPNVFLLDGDIGRKAYNDTIGYTREERHEGAFRNARVAKMLADQGIDVVCCTISMYQDVRDWNREHLEQYCEIFMDVPMEILEMRNKKGLYAKHREEKDVAGVDFVVDFPQHPDIRIKNDGSAAVEEVFDALWRRINE